MSSLQTYLSSDGRTIVRELIAGEEGGLCEEPFHIRLWDASTRELLYEEQRGLPPVPAVFPGEVS